MSILQQILATKHEETERSRRRLPAATLQELVKQLPPPRGFAAALRSAVAPRIIAEVKRASPAKGVLRPNDPVGTWKPAELARAYEAGGAVALSVLTDVHFFWGHPDALGACRDATALPVLRKDFIVDPYQVLESRWLGADAILLITRALTPDMLQRCAAAAQALGMDVLCEVHDGDELVHALALSDAIIGINNRNLSTLQVDVERSVALRGRIPKERLVIAESGIQSAAQIARLTAAGLDGFLIGEHLARHDTPRDELQKLRGE